MCFSASASFAASAALAGIGALSIRRARGPRSLPLAAIPLLFAAQQACEGVVWRELRAAPWGVKDTLAGHAFLFFALLVWPAYLPLALAIAEPLRARRVLLSALAALGLALGVYLVGCVSFRETNACIAFGNLYYWIQIDFKRPTLLAYLALIAGPLLLSSLRGTSVLAALSALSFALTGWLYRAGFVSVWCFFAALLAGAATLVNAPQRTRAT